MSIITVFKDIKTPEVPYLSTPEVIYERIKSNKYKDIIESLRKIGDKKKRDKIKQTLPSICWSGKFSHRENKSLKEHSGFVCVDFDHILELEDLKKRICGNEYTYMAFISPSGDGLKVIIKIPASIDTHADSCRAITDYFKEEDALDEFRDVARVCFISYDPDIYFNPDSKVFTNLLQEKKENTQVFYPTERLSDSKEIFDRVVKWLEGKDNYSDGNKHSFLVKLAAACLRFGIIESDCSSWMHFTYASKASRVDQKDFNQIANGIYKNYSHTSCTAHFEQAGKPIYTASKKEVKEEIFDIELHEKDIIYLDNVSQSMFEGFKTGKAKGETTYYPTFDNHWSWRRKEVTFLGGIGNMGKTIQLNNLCLLRAMYNDWKFAIFSPEQDPPDDFYNDLIHTYVGKSTEPYHHNQMTEEEYKNAMVFVKNHFYYIYPETESPKPEYINDCFAHAIKKHNVDVCIVDPFNQLDNDWRKYGRDDLYISEFLSNCKRFSQTHNIAYMIVGHPKGNLQKISGNYEIPNVYDYSGGAMWNNKCDNILCYHRPYAITDPESTECVFVSQKIKKRKLTGIPGASIMNFDVYTNRFTDENGFCPFEPEVKTNPIVATNADLETNSSSWYEKDTEEIPF
jgi:hypothetical protein